MPTRDRKVRMRVISRMDTASPELAEWFAGQGDPCLECLLPNEDTLLGVRWRAWKREHPQARPPASHTWLDDETDPRQATPEQIRAARRLLSRDK